jgi:CHAD domain-containing protein
MTASTSRYDLLQARAARLSIAVRRLGKPDARAIANLRLAVRRLREVLPILQLEPKTVQKLDARLRKQARRLSRLHEVDAHLALIADLQDIDRQLRQGIIRVTNDLQRQRTKTAQGGLPKKVADAFGVLLGKISASLGTLHGRDSSSASRPARWALRARVARRAATLRTAIGEAGPVYLPGRLRDVRHAVRKLTLGVELLSDTTPANGAGDVKALEQAQGTLDQLRDAERLIDRIGRMQAALSPSEVRAREEFDALRRRLEDRCRRIHARYIRERALLLALCDRVSVKVMAPGMAKRKAG